MWRRQLRADPGAPAWQSGRPAPGWGLLTKYFVTSAGESLSFSGPQVPPIRLAFTFCDLGIKVDKIPLKWFLGRTNDSPFLFCR